MRKLEKRTKGMRALAAAFALVVGLTSFNGISALAGRMKDDRIKKEYKTDDIGDSLLELGKKAVRVGENTYDVTLSVKDNSFEHEKKMPLSNTDVVFVVDTSSSMEEGNGWKQLKKVLGDTDKGLVYNILGGDNKDSNNSVTFVGYNGNLLSFSNPDYYISSKFGSSDINEAVAEYADYNKMSGKISDNTAGSNMTAGFRGAGKVFDYLSGKDRKKIAVLITDGDPSVGYTTLSNPYTLYSDTVKMPSYDWEAYTQKVWCWYYKDAGNGKYIFSDDEASKRGDGLTQGRTHYGYIPKWRKIIKEGKTKYVNNESILKEAELLKKRTFNNKIYTVKVKNTPSELLEHGLFRDYYDGRNAEVGNRIYENIYNDVVKKKTSKLIYKAAPIKIVDELSDYVNWDNDKVVAKIGDEIIDLSDYEIYSKYDNGRLIWTIPNGIPEGKTISLTYKVKLSDKAVIPGKGKDEDYNNSVAGLIKTAENTGTHAGKYAYPVSKEKQSYASYGVKEFDEDAVEGKDLKGDAIDNEFPVAGVRPDQKTFKLNVVDVYGSDKSQRSNFVNRTMECDEEYNVSAEPKDGWVLSRIVVNGKTDENTIDQVSKPVTGNITEDTTIEFIYTQAKGKVVVCDSFTDENNKTEVVVRNSSSDLNIGSEYEYSALTTAELDAKGYKLYDIDEEVNRTKKIKPESGTPNIVKFNYVVKKEIINVYDHFNGGDGVLRKDAEITVRQGSKIVDFPNKLEADAIKQLEHEGEWKAVKQSDDRYFTVESKDGVRTIHFYYVQKAKITIKAHYQPVVGESLDKELAGIEEDKYFGDKVTYTDKESGSEYELKAVLVNSETIQFNTDENSKTVIFNIDRPEVTVDYYYEKLPEGRIFKNAIHTYKEYNEDGTDIEILAEKSGKEGTEYIFNKKELLGWKLKEVKVNGVVATEADAKGLFGDSKKIEFIYEKDMVDIVVENIYSAEDDSIQDERVVHKVVNVQRGTKLEFTPELDADHEKWETEEGKKEVDTKPDFGTENETVFKVSFTFKKKKFNVTVVDNFIGLDHEIRSVSSAAIDTLFSVSALSREGWELKKDEKANIEFKLTKDEVIEFKYVKVDKNPAIMIYDHFGTTEPTTNESEKRKLDEGFVKLGEYYEYKPLSREGWIAKTGVQNGIAGDKDIILHFFYEAKSSGGNGGGDNTGSNDGGNSTDNPPSPSTDTPVVNITEDTTPQGTAPTTPTNPSEDNTDETGIVDINEDDTPQGEADIEDDKTPKGIAKTTEKVKVEDDATPQGNAALPKTGGTNADIFGLIGLGLIGLGLAVKKRK